MSFSFAEPHGTEPLFLVDYNLAEQDVVVASLQIISTRDQCCSKDPEHCNYRISLLRRAKSKIQTQYPEFSCNQIIRTNFREFTKEDYLDFE